MIVRMQFRLASAAEWEASNPVLVEAEPGYDTTNKAFKLGDGVTAWNDLGFQSADVATFQGFAAAVAAGVADAQTAATTAQEAATDAQEASTRLAVPLVTTEERPDPSITPGRLIYDTTLSTLLIARDGAWEAIA
jgi:hypothetical protein